MTISKTERNLWSAFIDEAKANQVYVAYAIRAVNEGFHEAAEVFMEASGAESIHALTHFRVAGEVRSTVENLVSVIQEEAREADIIYPRRIREAEAEGRADAAESFKLAWRRERHHIDALEEVLNSILQRRPDLKPLVKKAQQQPERDESYSMQELTQLSNNVPPSVRTEVFEEKSRVIGLQRLREVVFGAQDGLVSTVAVVSSVAIATGENTVVILAGAAAALAGMVSMAGGSYLGSRAEQDVSVSELEFEAREIRDHPAEEMAELIALYQHEGMSQSEATDLAERIASDRQLWLATMAEKELGLSPQLPINPVKDSLTMGISFILGSLFPLVLYFFVPAQAAVLPAILLTLVALFAVGVGKGMVLHKKPLISGLEVTAVGSLSGIVGVLIGNFLPRLLGFVSLPG
jgi:VIT1/CCC1 family predicted Fe2+/Mn2+ transporter/rubrerythrin